MDAFWHDLRSGVRSLTKARGFTAVAVLVFALGIGINTALFSIVGAVFYRPLPVEAPEQLVYIYQFVRNSLPFLDHRAVNAFTDRTDTFAGVTAHSPGQMRLTINGETVRLNGEGVLANYFDVLGAKPARGRTFVASEGDGSNTQPAMVISDRLWARRFDRDPGILGRTVRMCCRADPESRAAPVEAEFTIIGVMPAGFKGVSDPWTPSDYWVTIPGHRYSAPSAIARRHPSVTLRQAQEVISVLGGNLLADLRQEVPLESLHLFEGRRYEAFAAGDVATPFNPRDSLIPARLALAMTVVVAVVLLIAAANIAGLLTARGVSRASDTAVRRILGAPWWRLMRQRIAESLLLSFAGGALGLLLSAWLLDLFQALTPDRFSIDIQIDWRVVLFTCLTCVGAGLASGLAPALQALRIDPLRVLPGTTATATSHGRSRLRHGVVVPQVALALVLLVAAGLQVRALTTLELADSGYVSDDVIVVSTGLRAQPGENLRDPALKEKRAERSRTYYRTLLANLERVEGAADIAVTSTLPVRANAYTNYETSYDAVTQDEFLAGRHGTVGAAPSTVGPGYFRTLGMRIVMGRDFDERDAGQTPPVVIVSETLAQRLWRGNDPIGRTMALQNRFASSDDTLQWLEVVGVVNDVDPVLRDTLTDPQAYLAMGQSWQPSAGAVVARVPGPKPAAVDAIRGAVLGADSFAEVYSVRTLDQAVAEILYPRRMAAAILGASGLIGLLLASIGLYGVISYSVALRAYELGVRSALGASRVDIIRLVLSEGAAVTAIGSIVGGALTYAAIRLSANLVAGMPPIDQATLVAVPLVLAAVILSACYLPARRAARVDPLVSLRTL